MISADVITETPKVWCTRQAVKQATKVEKSTDILPLEIPPFKSYANYIIVCSHYLRVFSDNPLKTIEPKAFRWVNNIHYGMHM